MPATPHLKTVHELLTDLSHTRGPGTPECLKDLFWSHLNYDRANLPISRAGWPDPARKALADDPTVFATAAGDNFQVIVAKLASDRLSPTDERAVVEQMLKQHPYALFLFTNRPGDSRHFLNVKYDERNDRRRLYRRIAVAKGEQLRTATERVELLDIGAKPVSALEIQNVHDTAFDVEAVTKAFYDKYEYVFRKVVEPSITGIAGETRRLFTQRLFNRLMFIAFIQKEGQ